MRTVLFHSGVHRETNMVYYGLISELARKSCRPYDPGIVEVPRSIRGPDEVQLLKQS